MVSFGEMMVAFGQMMVPTSWEMRGPSASTDVAQLAVLAKGPFIYTEGVPSFFSVGKTIIFRFSIETITFPQGTITFPQGTIT